MKVLSHYKFYLAFENLGIDDYVSEKVFEGFIAGSVPIYRGSNSINKFMPCPSSATIDQQQVFYNITNTPFPSSSTSSSAVLQGDCYINANDLSPLQVANLIKYYSLPEHENKYNQFFEFKKRPLDINFEKVALMSYTHPNVLCRLCEYTLDYMK